MICVISLTLIIMSGLMQVYLIIMPGLMQIYPTVRAGILSYVLEPLGITAYYSFQQHGYAPISPERMPAVFNALQDRLDGYLTVNATNFSNDPSLRKLDTLSLLLGDEAKAAKLKHQEYMANKSKPQKLKQI